MLKVSSWSEVYSTLAPYLMGFPDHALMSCNCIVSETEATSAGDSCPRCLKPAHLLGPVLPLRDIYKEILTRREQETRKRDLVDLVFAAVNQPPTRPTNHTGATAAISTSTSTSSSSSSSSSSGGGGSTIAQAVNSKGLFQPTNTSSTSVASTGLASASASALSVTSVPNTNTSSATPSTTNLLHPSLSDAPPSADALSVDHLTNFAMTPLQSASPPSLSNLHLTNSSTSGVSFTAPSPTHPPLLSPQREMNYIKCFPVYRKQFMHLTQPRNFLRGSKQSFYTAISPDATKFVLASKGKWQLFEIPTDYNDSPILIYSGDIVSKGAGSGGSGSSMTTGETQAESGAPSATRADDNTRDSAFDSVIFVSMSDSFVMFACDHSIICYPIWDLAPPAERPLQPSYVYHSTFAIHCATVSPQGSFIAHAIVGRDKNSSMQRPMIVLHCVEPESLTANQFAVRTVIFTSPYNDPITTLSFSYDDVYLSCSTFAERRFIVISVVKPSEPRLLVKSARTTSSAAVGGAGMATDAGSDGGITSLRFFPGSSRLLVITSSSSPPSNPVPAIMSPSSGPAKTASPPIILDTKLTGRSTSTTSSNSNSWIEKAGSPSKVMRIDKVGSAIFNSEPSPRRDAVAFLDKSGLVYVMHSPGLLADNRKISVVADVASTNSFRESASMRFTPAGDVLIIVDRKGVCHIQDFGAGLPHHAGIGKCRLLL